MTLVIAGPSDDLQLTRLRSRARARQLDAIDLTELSVVTLDPHAPSLEIDSRRITPTGLFSRPDWAAREPGVKFAMAAWHAVANGIAACFPTCRSFNQLTGRSAPNKLEQLRVAASLGLPIPQTIVTNRADVLRALPEPEAWIAKPVAGGRYTQPLAASLTALDPAADRFPAPALAQEALVGPETRVYLIDGRVIAFEVASDHLDYRIDRQARITRTDVDDGLANRLRAVAQALHLQFGAVDLKIRAGTGEQVFLEINSSPMFAGFERNGFDVSDAILDALTGRDAVPRACVNAVSNDLLDVDPGSLKNTAEFVKF